MIVMPYQHIQSEEKNDTHYYLQWSLSTNDSMCMHLFHQGENLIIAESLKLSASNCALEWCVTWCGNLTIS